MDIEHFYIEKGRGFPLILLHGNGEDCDYFRGQIDEFSKQYHVYAIDTRGHGRTPRVICPLRYDNLQTIFWSLWMSIK